MISKNEREMTSLCKDGKEIGLITTNQMGTVFFLYERIGDDYRKLGKADSPLELETKYKMHERMGVKK